MRNPPLAHRVVPLENRHRQKKSPPICSRCPGGVLPLHVVARRNPAACSQHAAPRPAWIVQIQSCCSRSYGTKRTRDNRRSGIESKHQRRCAAPGGITIQPSIRAYSGTPFGSVDTAKTITPTFVVEGKGAQQLALLCGIGVTSVRRGTISGSG